MQEGGFAKIQTEEKKTSQEVLNVDALCQSVTSKVKIRQSLMRLRYKRRFRGRGNLFAQADTCETSFVRAGKKQNKTKTNENIKWVSSGSGKYVQG